MAEINIPNQSGKRRKSQPIRVDLTPMVDLGFLLIAFFMFTTTLAKPGGMDITMPDRTGEEPTVFIDTSTITLIPVKDHKCFYYYGALAPGEDFQVNTINNIRPVIMNKQAALKLLPSSFSEQAHKLHVLIKPNDDCSYEDVVSLLDEMTISQVPFYTIADLTPEEKQLVTNKLQNSIWK